MKENVIKISVKLKLQLSFALFFMILLIVATLSYNFTKSNKEMLEQINNTQKLITYYEGIPFQSVRSIS